MGLLKLEIIWNGNRPCIVIITYRSLISQKVFEMELGVQNELYWEFVDAVTDANGTAIEGMEAIAIKIRRKKH